MDKRVSVLVLNWNGAKILEEYIPSWIEGIDRDDAELIIIDNGSTDNSVQILREKYPYIKTILFDKNYGFAEGYNRAIEMVDSEIVVLLNSDVETPKSWLNAPLLLLDENKEISAVQPKILSRRNKNFFEYAGAAGGFIDKFGYPFCRGRIFDTLEEDRGQYDEANPYIFWASGAALFVRRNVYQELGGLDSSFFAHQEEIDLCWRMQLMGYKVAIASNSKVYHYGGASLEMNSPKKVYLNFRNNLLMIYKNIEQSHLHYTMFCRFVLDNISLLMFALKGNFALAKSVFRARIDFYKMLSNYEAIRGEIQKKRKVKSIETQKKYSIVYKYFFLGRKTFNNL